MPQKSALFVCLGNICRSPIAEACCKQVLQERGLLQNWKVDSAATSSHETGNKPDHRGQMCMKSHDVFHHVQQHRSRKITQKDYDDFDYIFCMDESNKRDLLRMAPKAEHKSKIHMLGSYDDDKSFGGIIEDPYYDNSGEEFEVVFSQCRRSCENFIKSLQSD